MIRLLCSLLFSTLLAAQVVTVPPLITPGTVRPDAFADTAGPEPDPEPLPKVVVDVDVVDVFFNVKRDGRLVPGLRLQDFELRENGALQNIRYFSEDADQPLMLAFLLDTSNSQARVLARERQMAKDFLREVLRNHDRALAVSFDSVVQLHQDFTSSIESILAAVDRAQPGLQPGSVNLEPWPPPHGRSTALYDAIHLIATQKLSRERGRKVMVIVTDGQDMGSHTAAPDAISAALAADTICYILLIGDPAYMSAADYEGLQRMKRMARDTGGRMIAARSLQKMDESFQAIANELRHQYSIGYSPSQPAQQRAYRKIQLRCKQGEVQARHGYFAQPRRSAVQ
jgi:VWFA-related protein